MGCEFKQRREHDVMDEDWSVSPVTNRLRDKAWWQLGTSGSEQPEEKFVAPRKPRAYTARVKFSQHWWHI